LLTKKLLRNLKPNLPKKTMTMTMGAGKRKKRSWTKKIRKREARMMRVGRLNPKKTRSDDS
jgi:hypothetical protein